MYLLQTGNHFALALIRFLNNVYLVDEWWTMILCDLSKMDFELFKDQIAKSSHLVDL